MSGFVKTHRFETTFDGDTVTADLSPLTYGDMLSLQGLGTDKEGVAGFVHASREILPKYVSNLAGLKDSSGNALGVTDVVEHVYFTSLLNELIGKLIELSQPAPRPT